MGGGHLLLAVVVAILASNYNRNAWGWFFLAVIFSPILVVAVLLIVGRLDAPTI